MSHLGFIVLGTAALTSAGFQGAVIQNVNHGLTTGALFLLVGMIYERRHTKKIERFRRHRKGDADLRRPVPLHGLRLDRAPGLNGFVGEFLVLIGSFPTLPGFAAVAAFGVILAAIYLLWAYERVFTGVPDKPENQQLTDLNAREIGLMVPLVILMLVLGMYPKILLDRTVRLDRGAAGSHRTGDDLRGARARAAQ